MIATFNSLITYQTLTKNYLMLFKRFFIALFCVLIISQVYCIPSKFRVVGIGDLSTEMTIVFDSSFSGNYQVETNPKVYYGTNYSQVNNLSSTFIVPSSVNTNSQMRNNICRLNNLTPHTTYYFKVTDDKGSSQVYHFETLPNDTSPLSIIAGGDSRSNRSVRVNANKMVAKLKPHAILFTGDFTDNGVPIQWQWWFEDWQYTIDAQNRIIPIIPTRGNHESNDNFLIDLFGAPQYVYYTSTNNSLLTVVTLNTEKAVNAYGTQTTWLQNSLSQINTTYTIAQYHKPMKPHVNSKLEGVAQFAYWAEILEDHKVDLVVESDAHTSKTTWPVVVCTGGLNCDEGFKRDDENGVVYTGEGCWGAPLRNSNDNKSWTRSSGMFNQFKLLLIDENEMELRTVLVDNEGQVSEVNINNRFNLPPNQNVWTTGEVVSIRNKNNNTFPTATLVYPPDNTILYNNNPITLRATAKDSNGSISRVSFYINGNLINEDFNFPYQYNYNPPTYGQYLVHIIATDNEGLTSCIDLAAFSVVNSTTTLSNWTKLNSTTDDAEQYSNGFMDLFNWDIDLGYNGYTCGFRFLNVNIPPGATVTNAYIQFTADEEKFNPTNLTIYGEKNADAKTFFIESYNMSNRIKTDNIVPWDVNIWPEIGESNLAQRTPDLSNILNEIITLPNYSLESPFLFIIEGSGHRATETVDGDSIKAPVLHYSYQLGEVVDNLIDVWPGDTDNNGVVNSKDVLYVCLSYNNTGPSRLNASTNWIPQPVMPWNSLIDHVNFAHQDADGNGSINLNDIEVVVSNYGAETPWYISPLTSQTKVLKLRQSSAPDRITEYELYLESDLPVLAHGIHGSIDLSEFLKSDLDKVQVDSTLNSALGEDVLFTKYHEDTKILDFAISRTDQQNQAIQNTSLLRVIIIIDDLIDGGKPKKAIINSSGIVLSEGKYESLRGSTFYSNLAERLSVDQYMSDFNFNLITTNVDCDDNGSAEVQIFNENLSSFEFEWSNGTMGHQVDNLAEGSYMLTIKKDNVQLKTVDFSIDPRMQEVILIENVIEENTVYSASKEISIGMGIELTKNYTVGLIIEDCYAD